MTETVRSVLQTLNLRSYRKSRTNLDLNITAMLTGDERDLQQIKLRAALEAETLPAEAYSPFGFLRSNASRPYYLENGEKQTFWGPGNLTPDYETLLTRGLCGLFSDLSASRSRHPKNAFLIRAEQSLQCAYSAVPKMEQNARKFGQMALADALLRVPYHPAETLFEALVALKWLIFVLRLNENVHLTLGRFDQYLYPYYEKSRKSGMTDAEALELIKLFFLSLNFDSDLYHGIQKGDNGQSLVLGGIRKDGTDGWNELSELCMQAASELCLIDPKINIRTDKNTPMSRYILGTKLTAKGLGFPQYSNDDVVIPALISLGYEPQDAADYAVAACWEFIVPYCAMDVPNQRSMNFALAAEQAAARLGECKDYDDFLRICDEEVYRTAKEQLFVAASYRVRPDALLSVFIRGCVQAARDVSENGAKYNNSGMHGVGLTTAADAIRAIGELVFDRKEIRAEELMQALRLDFADREDIRQKLLAAPKLGSGDSEGIRILQRLIDVFAKTVNGASNHRGGIFRAGTGSAQGYIVYATRAGATADGRKAFSPAACSFSPSPIAVPKGLVTVIHTFSSFDLSHCMNGGPLTVEIHENAFRSSDSIEKTAALVSYFIRNGGHQLQINAVNREKLLDAQKNPQNYRGLVVRVWGWSGYFVELEKPYQDHIISRTEYGQNGNLT